MLENKNMPKFGVLSGVKVAHATMSTAGPFGPALWADWGADVIWLENSKAPDITRFAGTFCLEQDRKNQRSMGIDISTPEGKKILLKVLKHMDIFVESGKGGGFDKMGLSDEVLWEANPKLVIAHVSGFGQTGLPEYVTRPAYDTIAQAYSAVTWVNSNPNTVPYAVGPYIGDFFTALFVASTALAALYKANRTGIGESIDIAQFECCMRTQEYISDYFTDKRVVEQTGYPSPWAACRPVKCKDGRYVAIYFLGVGVLKKAIPFFGLEYGSEMFPEQLSLLKRETEAGQVFEQAVKAWAATRTADEAAKIWLDMGFPVSKVNDFEDLMHDPHIKARESITEWTSVKGTKVVAPSIVPKFKNNPGEIWRPAPWMGQDNEDILGGLGYSADEIKELYNKKAIGHDPEMKMQIPVEVRA